MLNKLNRDTLAEQVARNLEIRIEMEGLRPGSSLPSTAQLAADFGVSRPVIREALKSLEAKGLIEITNGKNAVVKPITTEPLLGFFQRVTNIERPAIREFMEIRKGLEIQSARLAAQRRTSAQLQEMKEIVAAMRENLYALDAFTELDAALHLTIARAAHNTMMVRLIESVREILKDTIREGRGRRHTQDQINRVQELHEGLLAALEEGDPQLAAQAMEMHFDEIAMSVGTDNWDPASLG